MMEARSVDIVMIDLVRVGGITQWMKVAGMAEAFNLPVVSHLIPEVHVHLIGAVPNGLTVEYMPWLRPLVQDSAGAAERRAGDADRARPRPRIRPGDDRPLSRVESRARGEPTMRSFAWALLLLVTMLAGCNGGTLDAIYPETLGHDPPPAVNLPPQSAGMEFL